MGRCAEETAKLLGISREAQDDYGLGSYERAERAAAAGIAAKQITTVVARRAGKEYTVDSDEEVREKPKPKHGERSKQIQDHTRHTLNIPLSVR